MNRFDPHRRELEPAHPPDDLTVATMLALARPVGGSLIPRLPRTTISAIFTFGVWPVLRWAKMFRRFAQAETQQLQHLCECLRPSQRRELAEMVHANSGGDVVGQFTKLVAVLTLILTALLARAMPGQLSAMGIYSHPFYLRILLACTWQQGAIGVWPHAWMRLTHADPILLSAMRHVAPTMIIWNIGLSLAFIGHWLRVQLQANETRQFIERFNLATTSTVMSRMPGLGIGPGWILLGIVITLMGGYWGLPMAIAASAHRRYIRRASVKNRLALAAWVKARLAEARPAVAAPEPYYLRRLCPRERCRAQAPPQARFCARCGMPLLPVVDQKA